MVVQNFGNKRSNAYETLRTTIATAPVAINLHVGELEHWIHRSGWSPMVLLSKNSHPTKAFPLTMVELSKDDWIWINELT